MRTLAFLFLIFIISQTAVSQEKGFDRRRVFIGSGINLGFFNGFILGLNPEVGYTVGKVLDVGISTNFTLITQNDPFSPNRDRLVTLGGGPFLRIWPLSQFFVGGQFEFNSISFTRNANGVLVFKDRRTAPSLLVGGGYGSRFIGQSQFYTSILVDVMGDPNSPYTDQFGRMQPVFRTAFTFYLKERNQSRSGNRRGYSRL
ncbi:MAG: hypothetical protein ACK50E_02165 [Bacteroidota bacterium]